MLSRAWYTLLLLVGASALCNAQDLPVPHDPRIAAIIHSLEQVHEVRQTALSPNGKSIAWVVGGPKGSWEIEAAPLADPAAAHRVTACVKRASGKEDDVAWSPDSNRLAFFSDCGAAHAQALYLVDPFAHAAPKKLAEIHGFAKSAAWSPDGKRLAFLYVEGATRPSGALAAEKPPSGVIGVEGLEVQRVAVVDADGGALRQATPANLHVFEFDWSPDSSRLAYVAAPPPGENNWWVAQLYTQSAAGGQPKSILNPSTTPGPLHGLQIAVPRWSPDGGRIAFIGGLMSDQGATGGDLYIIPSTGGVPVDFTAGSRTTVSWITWTPSHHILASEIDGGSPRFVDCVLTGGRVQSKTLFSEPASIGDGGAALALSLSADRHTVAYIRSSFDAPPEVYAGRLGSPLAAITHYNGALKPLWGKAESVDWTNEGFHVQGWLLYPSNYDPAKKYPMIVSVHGGPSWAVMPRWPELGYNPVAFSGLGYFVLMPNPRGSFGQGEKFAQANRRDFGYGDLRDILAGVAAVEKNHPVDDKRLGLTGWSYGGFMTMFAVTQTQRFHAAVAGAGISDWKSYYGENSIDQWMIPFFGASVYDDPAVYAKSSAINFIHKVKTPTLIVVGDRDGECPAPQSFEFWHALRAEHVPAELVVYPDEGHHFVSPDHQRDVLERALGWFAHYMP